MTLLRRIADLERRVRALEDRPPTEADRDFFTPSLTNQIKSLRTRTGASFSHCVRAVQIYPNDPDLQASYLRGAGKA